jgi:hypothetical protein
MKTSILIIDWDPDAASNWPATANACIEGLAASELPLEFFESLADQLAPLAISRANAVARRRQPKPTIAARLFGGIKRLLGQSAQKGA